MIPTRDGTRLAANLFLPAGGQGSYPAILSFYPYIKDVSGLGFAPYNRHFASRGYAALQVDFRGTGNSEGTNPHPFDPIERLDGYDIVEWIAAQDWCTGAVGMWGISYGGITSLSVASERPPHLSAIIPVDGTYDNYEWLLRTHGGRGLLLGDVDWGTRMAAMNLLPPVLEDDTGTSMVKWHERLEENRPWFLDWHGEPPDEGFWMRRQIPFEKINVPTFGICGWYDAYTRPTLDVVTRVQAPSRILIGPWKHILPDQSPTVPTGGLHEMDRWWDRWLKGSDNGVDREPPFVLYVMGDDRWRYENEWPPRRTIETRFSVRSPSILEQDGADNGADTYDYDPRVGLGSIGYNGHRFHLPLPTDQSFDDHRSLTYTTAPLSRNLEITGTPTVTALVSATVAEFTLVAKLCVIDELGNSCVISQGNANPGRISGHALLHPLDEGERRSVHIDLHPTATLVRAGQRIRLCFAGADFPELWPTPKPYTMTVHRDGTWVNLPVCPPPIDAVPSPELMPPSDELHDPYTTVRFDDWIHTSLDSRSVSFETHRTSRSEISGGGEVVADHRARVTTDADRPWDTSLRATSRFTLVRGQDTIDTCVESLLTPSFVSASARVERNGTCFFSRAWSKPIQQSAERVALDDDGPSGALAAREGGSA